MRFPGERVWVLCYDRRSVSKSVLELITHLGLTTRFSLLSGSCGLLMWGVPSDESTGLSFTIAAGLRLRSRSGVRVPWDSWPYFTVSDSRLPFSSPPTTRRVTVVVFDPVSTRDEWTSSYNNIKNNINDKHIVTFRQCQHSAYRSAE
jgi:hypothetical protein